jgi:hypothetical protein
MRWSCASPNRDGAVRYDYVLLQTGYLLQSLSLRNLAVVLLAAACNVGRIRAEELVLATNATHSHYRNRVRWKLLPGVW